jgi:hypothetical protein
MIDGGGAQFLIETRDNVAGGVTNWSARLGGATTMTTSNGGNSAGTYIGTRSGTTTSTIFRDDTQILTSTSTYTNALVARDIYLLAMNLGGAVYADSFSNNRIAFSTIGSGLTRTEVTCLNDAIVTFNTTLGRVYEQPFDPDAAAYLNEVLVSGGTGITTTYSAATNTLFTKLKSDGIYTKLDALYPLIGGVANSHAINAVNPGTFTMQWSGGITHNANGATGNGVNGIGNTQWVQNVQTTTGNTTLGFYMTLSGNQAFDLGRQVAGGFLGMNNYNAATNFRAAINAGLGNFQTNMSGQTGFYGLTRNNGTQVSYISPNNAGTTGANTETASLATSAVQVMTLGGFGSFSTKTYGTFVIGKGLTLLELQNLRTAINTFNNTIGR